VAKAVGKVANAELYFSFTPLSRALFASRFTCCAAAEGTVASQRERLATLENSGIARAEERAEEKTDATLTAAVTLTRLLPLRRAARAAPLRTASMDLD